MKKFHLIIVAAVLTMGCQDSRNTKAETPKNKTAGMEEAGKTTDWRDLFNGRDLKGWKAYNSEEKPSQWSIEEGTLAFAPNQSERSVSENLITEEKYTNFELMLVWKISKGGNSGILWGVRQDKSLKEPYLSGPEIQILDNKNHPDATNGADRQAGALYDMVPPLKDATNAAGEWNETVIRINYNENKGSVSMNGKQIVKFPLYGKEWDQLKSNSKFKTWEEFGKYPSGHIALQDHGDRVWFRKIKIRELE